MNRKDRVAVAEKTVKIIENGKIHTENGSIDVSETLNKSHELTKLYKVDETEAPRNYAGSHKTTFQVVNRTAGECIVELPSSEKNAVLNFASAKNPGGGFLSGASAQEEALARSSGLYKTLVKFQEKYDRNRLQSSFLYLDEIIYSPTVPFWFDDEGNLLPEIVVADVITAAAPNRAAMEQHNRFDEIELIETTFKRRIYKILELARDHNVENLILGAWGCGVFRNNSSNVAMYFRETIEEYFPKTFKQILFAVYDRAEHTPTYAAFKKEFAKLEGSFCDESDQIV